MKLTSTFYKLVVLTFLLLILLSDIVIKASWWYATRQAQKTLAANPSFVEDLNFYSQQGKSWDKWTNFMKPIEIITNATRVVKDTIGWKALIDFPEYGPIIKTADEILNGLVIARAEIHGIADLDSIAMGSKQFLQDLDPISLQSLAHFCSERNSYLEKLDAGFMEITGATNTLDELSNNFHSTLQNGMKSNFPLVPSISSQAMNLFDPAFRNVTTLHKTVTQYESQMHQDLATMRALITVTNKAQNIESFFVSSPLGPLIAFVNRYFIIVLLLLFLYLLVEIRLLMRQQGLTLSQLIPKTYYKTSKGFPR